MGYTVDVIVPTWNNPEYLIPMVNSMIRIGFFKRGDKRLIIVNNGKQPVKEQLGEREHILVLNMEENRGWEGGLIEGLKHSDAPFVCFQNDDVFLPQSSHGFYEDMLKRFNDPQVGMVGPVTTTAAGIQSVYNPQSPLMDTPVCWLIFFCVMMRRADLDAVGGIDETLPGGDDFDLSWRMHQAGKTLLVCPYTFIIHHAFKTGTRIRGDQDKDGGWNSQTMQDRTNKALIMKHGFANFFFQRNHQIVPHVPDLTDREGNVIAKLIADSDSVLELGCGTKRTVPQAYTVDLIKRDNVDQVADISNPLNLEKKYDVIIARHIIEHVINTTRLIALWKTYLNKGGRILLAVPNQHLVSGIPLDPQHCHAYTPESMQDLMWLYGFELVATHDPENGVSFVQEYRLCA